MLHKYHFVRWGVVCAFTVVLFLLETCGPSGAGISTPSGVKDEPASATVKADIGCRTGPTTDYPVRDTLKAGEVLSILGRSQSGDAWVVFNPDIHNTCWVEGAWVDVTGAMSQVQVIDPDPPGAPTATVKADAVCRTGPTADYDVRDTLKAGEILNIQGRSQSGDAWMVFNPDLQGTCWVEGAWVEVAGAMSQVEVINPDPPGAPTQGAATATVKAEAVCRTGPTAEYEVWDTLKAGEVLSIQGRNQNGDAWVVFNPDLQDTCWVEGVFVDVAGAMSQVQVIVPDPPHAPAQGAPTATVKENAICRTGPTIEYKILDYLKVGTVLNIVGRNRAGNSWVMEDPAIGRTCWIFGGLVEVTGDTSLVMLIDPDPLLLSSRRRKIRGTHRSTVRKSKNTSFVLKTVPASGISPSNQTHARINPDSIPVFYGRKMIIWLAGLEIRGE